MQQNERDKRAKGEVDNDPARKPWTSDTYGVQQCRDHYLQQYLMYVQTAESVSERRASLGTTYVTMLSGLMAVGTLAQAFGISLTQDKWFAVAVSAMGIAMCITWSMTLSTYRNLNSAKFRVIQDMEKNMPAQCFTDEWHLLRPEAKRRKPTRKSYRTLTQIERWVPCIMAIPFILLLIVTVLTRATFDHAGNEGNAITQESSIAHRSL